MGPDDVVVVGRRLQRRHPVEVPPPEVGTIFDEREVLRREDHRRGRGAASPLAVQHGRPAARLHRDHHLAGRSPVAAEGPPQEKPSSPKPNHLFVPTRSEGVEGQQDVDRLQKIGFPLGIPPFDERHPLGKGELYCLPVPEVFDLQVCQEHRSLAPGLRSS